MFLFQSGIKVMFVNMTCNAWYKGYVCIYDLHVMHSPCTVIHYRSLKQRRIYGIDHFRNQNYKKRNQVVFVLSNERCHYLLVDVAAIGIRQ